MKISLDVDLELSKKGVNVNMKKFDVNDFVIDKIFKKISKKSKKKKDCKIEESEIKDSKTYFADPSHVEGYYTIDINL